MNKPKHILIGFARLQHWLPLAGAAYLTSACDDPLKRAELVEDLRVLGARVEVEGDPDRAAPGPGENASVRWLVATPEADAPVGWALSACVAATVNVGVPRCEGAPFASQTSAAPEAAAPALAFQIPAEIDPETSPRVVIVGSICRDAVPMGDPEDSRCPGGTEGTQVTLEFELARPDDVNRNPRFGEPALALDGAPWPATAPASCEGDDVVRVRAGSGSHAVRIAVAADARDPVPPEGELDPERESLRVSHFSDGGELEHAFSSIPFDSELTEVSVPWNTPKSVPAEGRVVRFWFVLRDLRGGSDFLERAVCVEP
jgi:hypothetical protein